MNCYILGPGNLKIGNYVHINQWCFLDARGGLTIKDNVSISHYSKFVTGGHDWNDPEFAGVFLPIIIEDYVWIGVQCIILQNTVISEGSVIGSGSLITKDTDSYGLYVGVPGKKIKSRIDNLYYHPLINEGHFRFL